MIVGVRWGGALAGDTRQPRHVQAFSDISILGDLHALEAREVVGP